MNEQKMIVVEQNAIIRASLRSLLIEGGFSVSGAYESVAALREGSEQSQNLTVVLSCARGGDVDDQVKEVRALHASAAVVVLGGRCDLQSAVRAIQAGANACLHDATDSDAFFRLLRVASKDVIVIALPWQIGELAKTAAVANVTFREVPKGVSAAQPSVAAPVVVAVPVTTGIVSEPQRSKFDSGRREPNLRQDDVIKIGRANAPAFSPREAAILQYLRKGEPNKRIARELSLTESTVKVYLKSILRKIGVNNRTQAAVWAMSSLGEGEMDFRVREDLVGSQRIFEAAR